MDIYTMDRGFLKTNEIDTFETALWNERYYGDGEFELSVPQSSSMISKLPTGTLMGCVGSNRPMIIENREIKDGIIKVSGIELAKWLNNRFIRSTNQHSLKEWWLGDISPGAAMCSVVMQMCGYNALLTGPGDPLGIPWAITEKFIIPGLGIQDDTSPATFGVITVPYGPVYDSIKPLAETYEIGMEIILDYANDIDYQIIYRTYNGRDCTRDQSVNDVIMFSPDTDSFTNIQDFESIENYKNFTFMFAPTAPNTINDDGPGIAFEAAALFDVVPGFDVRAFQGFVESLPEEADTDAEVLEVLNNAAKIELGNQRRANLVDGEIVDTDTLKYGTHYFMGDIIELKGNTGVIQKARVIEYIRSQDSAGSKAYPTLQMID